MKLIVLVIIVAFVFIITYNPKREVIREMYQEAPGTVGQKGPTCDSQRYLELQGITGAGLSGACEGAPVEYGGVIFYA
jgi:hypothetical protein